eukprot:1654675-Rhodomonas_salina.1
MPGLTWRCSLSALQRQTQQASREGTTTLPALRKSSPARKTNSHRRGSIVSIPPPDDRMASLFRSSLPGFLLGTILLLVRFLPSRQIDPAFLDAFYNEQEEPAKEEEEEKPEENQVDEEMERVSSYACIVGCAALPQPKSS